MPEPRFPAEEVPGDADEFFSLLCERVPSLAATLSQMLAPGAAVDFGPLAEQLEQLGDAGRHTCEQMFASFLNTAIRARIVEVSAAITDDDIVDAALTSDAEAPDAPTDGSILGVFQLLLEAARSLTVDVDSGGMRVLLASGYAPVLIDFDHSMLVRDADQLSRQVAVTAAAHEFVAPIEIVAMRLTELFTAQPDIMVRMDLTEFRKLTSPPVVEMLRYFPDVVDRFDTLLAARVPDAPVDL